MNILITGARSGIGYQTALELINKGHFVYLTVHTNEQLEKLKKDNNLINKNVNIIKLDVTCEEDRKKVKNLNIDILINNAAIGIGGSIAEASIEKIRENFEVNFFGTIQLTQVFLRKMIESNQGRIIMITSALGEIPFPWLGIYSSTKAALKNISMALDKELKEIKSNVKIVIVEPGFYFTGFNDVMLDNKYDNKNSIFKSFRDKIIKTERLKVKLLEKNVLKV